MYNLKCIVVVAAAAAVIVTIVVITEHAADFFLLDYDLCKSYRIANISFFINRFIRYIILPKWSNAVCVCVCVCVKFVCVCVLNYLCYMWI